MTMMLSEWVCTATFLILAVLALRAAFGKRVSARLRYALWLVVLVRLLVPVQLFTSPLAGTWVGTETRVEHSVTHTPSPVPTPALQPPAVSVGVGQNVPVSDDKTPGNVLTPPTLPDAPEPPVAPEAPDLRNPPDWMALLGWAWLAGSGALALGLAWANLRFARRLRRVRIPLEGTDCPLPVYAAAGLPSPCLFGVFRPAVYVTPEAAADPAMLRHVIAHEYTHFRQGDHLWSVLRCGALAAHWWNPLVWLAVALSRRDGELACDEGALKRLGDGERLAYGNTLLSLVTAKPGPGDLLRFGTTMAGDRKSLRERFTRIAHAPKQLLWAAVALVLVTALACVAAFGQAEDKSAAREPVELPTAELSFTLEHGEDGKPFVRIEGQVEDRVVKRTIWRTESYGFFYTVDYQKTEEEITQEPELSTGYEFSTGWAELNAKWADEGRTSVTLSTWMSATLSSYAPSGYWVFTVELSGDSGTVVSKEHSPWRDQTQVGSYMGELKLYPEALPNEEAVQAARYAARLLTAAEDYYNNAAGTAVEIAFSHKGNDTASQFFVPEEVLNAARAYAAQQFLRFAPDGWVTTHGFAHDEETGEDVPLPLPDPIQFDRVRISGMEGPYLENECGKQLELWWFKHEYHTDTPEKARILLAGGMSLTEDGWLCAEDGCNYLVFSVEEDGSRALLTTVHLQANRQSVGFRNALLDALQKLGLESGARYGNADALSNSDGSLRTFDLDGDGEEEFIQTCDILFNGVESGRRVEVWEGDALIWADEAYYNHMGWNAVFLCTLDGKDCLLRYNPYMSTGSAGYSYKLFTLSPGGEERTVKEGRVTFELNYFAGGEFGGPGGSEFIPEEIAAFMTEINDLLAHSVQLINTNSGLLGTFEKEGRLYDSLSWLDGWESTFIRDPSKSLLENLRAFKMAMTRAGNTPTVWEVDGMTHELQLDYKGMEVRFHSPWYHSHPEDTAAGTLVDLNGDGRDEIVVILHEGHGSGTYTEGLYYNNVRSAAHIDSLGQSLYGHIKNDLPGEDRFHPNLIAKVTEQDCIDYMHMVVIDRVFNGYMKEHGRL